MIMQLLFQCINYNAAQLIESSSPRSSGDSNRFGPARISLPHDIGSFRSRNYIYQPSLGSFEIGTGPALSESIVPTSLHRSSLTDSQECIHDTPAISPLLVRGYRFL
jgi:hypothetical protein